MVRGTAEVAAHAKAHNPGPALRRRQISSIEELMLRAAGERKIIDAVSRSVEEGGLGISRRRAKRLMEIIRARWAKEDEAFRATRKSEQRRRIQGHLARAMGGKQNDGTFVPMNHQAVARYESLLADIDGTREPIAVDVNVKYTETMVKVLAVMTPDRVAAMIEVAHERRRLAEAFRREHPETAASPEEPRSDLNGTGKH